MSVLDQDTRAEYETRNAETLAAVQAGGQDKVQVGKLAAAPTEWTATGQVTFATAFIWGTLTADLTFQSGEKMSFFGTHWGVGLGGGTSYGIAGFTVSPSQLVGEGTYEVHSVAGVGGFVQVIFFQNNKPVGVFTGAALAVNVSVGGGSGTWKMS